MLVFINSKLIINCNLFQRRVSHKACQYVHKYHLSDQKQGDLTLGWKVLTPLLVFI